MNVVPLLEMPVNVINPALLAVVLAKAKAVFTSKAAPVAVNCRDEFKGKLAEKTDRFKVPAIEPMVASMLLFKAVMLTSAVLNCSNPCITLPRPMPEPSITKSGNLTEDRSN